MPILVASSQRAVRVSKRMVRRQVRWILEGAGVPEFDVSLELTGDRRMRALNHALRGRARTTDILSVPLHEGLRAGETPPDIAGVRDLGDMFVSLPELRRQARDMGAEGGWKERLPVVVTHGVCHLLGYTHDNEHDTRDMQEREDQILEYVWDREEEYWEGGRVNKF